MEEARSLNTFSPNCRQGVFSEVRSTRLLRSGSLLESNAAARGILNCTNTGDFGGDGLHVAQRFELFLDKYRRPDGSRWTGQQLDEATGGVVSRSYVTNLRKGRIENPGYEKMRVMAKAMGFLPEAWFEDISGDDARVRSEEDESVAARVEHLFGVVMHPKTGKPYTS